MRFSVVRNRVNFSVFQKTFSKKPMFYSQEVCFFLFNNLEAHSDAVMSPPAIIIISFSTSRPAADK